MYTIIVLGIFAFVIVLFAIFPYLFLLLCAGYIFYLVYQAVKELVDEN